MPKRWVRAGRVRQADRAFRPVRRRGGYLALEDLGLIGDGTTAALVGLDGSIPWLCLPRFDSEPLFCGLLDAAGGGAFTVAPEEVVEARQRYEPDTAVLVTELRSPTGLLAVTDALALRPGAVLSDDAPAGRRELIRSAVVLGGSVRVRVELEPRGGASAQAAASGLSVHARCRPDLELHVRCNRPLDGLCSVHELHAGERVDVALSWGGGTAITGSARRSCSPRPPARGASGCRASTTTGRRARSSAGPRSRSSCATTGATAR
jgi:GH15 family glucan-1,4-alpha-glucosidase